MKSSLSTVATVGCLILAGGYLSAAAAAADTINKTFTVEPGGKLAVDADRGSVQVVAADRSQVEVLVERDVSGANDSRAAEILKDHEVTLTQEGNEVRVRAKLAKPLGNSWFGRQPNLNVRYQITVPFKFNVDLKTGGGSVKVTGVQGQVKAGTGGGSVTVSEAQGEIEAHTGGGSIHATSCTGPMQLKTGGGSIEVRDFTGPSVQARTGGGSISADLRAQPKSDCSLHTGGGGIELRIPESLAVTLDAHTGGGSVRTEIAEGPQPGKNKNALRGPMNGGGPTLSLSTGGGSIRILKGERREAPATGSAVKTER